MAFQIKDFLSIAISMLNHAKATQDKITDFNVGGVARTMLEAPAIEIEELYLQMFHGLMDAIPIATFQSFDFESLPAVRGFGYVTVYSATPLADAVAIPAGTAFTTSDGRKYLSELDLTWAAGSTSILVLVRAESAGVAWNIGAGMIARCALFDNMAGITFENDAIVTGKDVESDDERKVRFADFIQSLSKGTDAAITYAVRQVVVDDEYVLRSGIDGGGGHVRVYLYSSRGIPSAALLAKAQKVVDGYRDGSTGQIVPGYAAAGVRTDVLAMAEKYVTMTVRVGMLPGETLDQATINLLRDKFSEEVHSVESNGVLLIDALVERLLSVAGVLKVVPAVDANVQCGVNEVLVPGVLTVEVLSE